MRLLYVIEHISTAGGLERILIDKMNALACEQGYDVNLLTVWQEDAPPSFPLHKNIKHTCLGITQPKSTLQMLCAMPRVVYAFNKAVRHLSPDITIHFRAIGAMLIAFSSWRGYSVFEAHTARPHSNHRWLYPIMERKADTIVCLTNADAQNYPHAKRIEVIPNFTTISDSQQPDYSRQTCIFLGRLCPEKNPLRLLRLWHKINELHPDWHLHIYGTGPMEDEVKNEIIRLKLAKSVKMLGHTSDIKQAYLSGSILLLTSNTEGLPMVLIEAQEFGLPVVCFDCPYGPSDIIHNGKNGYLIPLSDDETFISAVDKLINSSALREQMGDNAKQQSSEYNKVAIIQRWKHFFSSNEDTTRRRI